MWNILMLLVFITICSSIRIKLNSPPNSIYFNNNHDLDNKSVHSQISDLTDEDWYLNPEEKKPPFNSYIITTKYPNDFLSHKHVSKEDHDAYLSSLNSEIILETLNDQDHDEHNSLNTKSVIYAPRSEPIKLTPNPPETKSVEVNKSNCLDFFRRMFSSSCGKTKQKENNYSNLETAVGL